MYPITTIFGGFLIVFVLIIGSLAFARNIATTRFNLANPTDAAILIVFTFIMAWAWYAAISQIMGLM